MLGIVTVIPGTVMPGLVDYSAADLVARISRLDDVNDARRMQLLAMFTRVDGG